MTITLGIPGTIGEYNWANESLQYGLGASNDFAPPKGGTPQKNEAARAKTTSALFSQLMYIVKEFQSVGFPTGMILTYALAQMMLESDWMTSVVANWDNNYSGIKWINQPYQKATRGLKAPDGGYYAHFATFTDWIRDYRRILSLNTGGQGRPIDATTAQQFIDRLRANKYFTDPNYHTKFNSALRRVGEALIWGKKQEEEWKRQRAAGQDTFTVSDTPDGKGLTSNEKFDFDRWMNKAELWAKDHPVQLGGIALVAALVLNKLLK